MMVGVLIAGAVIVLLVWIVPLRRRGIRGIRLRGPKLSAILSASAAEDERERQRRRGNVPPQVARDPAQDEPGRDEPGREAPGQDAPGQDAPGRDAPGQDEPGRDAPGGADGRDGHVLAELEKNWEPGYVERVEAFFRSRKH